MPKLWSDTINAHRREVRDAILDATVALVAKGGLRSVTMSEVAERSGIGRATLYKYFADVEAILAAWHEREVGGHVRELHQLATADGSAWNRLRAYCEAYAQIQHAHRGHEVAAALHGQGHVVRARQHVTEMLETLLSESASEGQVREDVSPRELALYCMHALEAATALRSKAAVERLIAVTMAGLRRE